MAVQYIRDLSHSPVDVVVHDHVGGEITPDPFLFPSTLDPARHLFFVVSSRSQAVRLFVNRRRQEEDEHGVGIAGLDLRRTLKIDFEDHDGSRRVLRERCAVEVAKEFGPLYEPTFVAMFLECLSIYEGVRVFRLTAATRPRGPRLAQPQRRVTLYET